MFNEFFNELANNPGKSQGGFLFFLDWANHNLNSVLSSADAHGVLGRTLVYFNCEIASLLKAVGEVNPNVNLLVGLLNPPTKVDCQAQGILKGAAAVHKVTPPKAPAQKVLSGLAPAFGKAASKSPETAKAKTAQAKGGAR